MKLIEVIQVWKWELWSYRARLRVQRKAKQIASDRIIELEAEHIQRTADFAWRALMYEERIAELEIVAKVAVYRCSGMIAIPIFHIAARKSLRIWRDLEHDEIRAEVR